MTELYSFLFCIALGVAARLLFMVLSLVAKRTDLLPVTAVLDALTVIITGGAFTAYVILSGATLAPYMFAALAAGYLFTYWLIKPSSKSQPAQRTDRPKKAVRRKSRNTAK